MRNVLDQAHYFPPPPPLPARPKSPKLSTGLLAFDILKWYMLFAPSLYHTGAAS